MKWWFILFCVINLFIFGFLVIKCLLICCEVGLFVVIFMWLLIFLYFGIMFFNFDFGMVKFLFIILLVVDEFIILFNLFLEVIKFLLLVKLLIFIFGVFLNLL